ncbi:MAG: hypothetical protein JWO81_221 [Alphaproteobacteria bacterium]|nr:hypothetical protein [Alphaproteobacteria bacterium]
MPETVTFERPTEAERAAERAEFARRVFAEHLEPGHGADRLTTLAKEAQDEADLWRARAALLRALQDDPDWRTALLAAGVGIVEPPDGEGVMLGGPELWEAIDLEEGIAIARRAAERVKAAGGPAIARPMRLLTHYAPDHAQPSPARFD